MIYCYTPFKTTAMKCIEIFLAIITFTNFAIAQNIETNATISSESLSISYHIEAIHSANKGHYDQAFESINKALELSPDNVAHLTYKASLLIKISFEKESAMDLLDRAIAKSEKSSEAYYYRGILNKQLKYMEAACNDFETSAALNYPLAEKRLGAHCNQPVINIVAAIE